MYHSIFRKCQHAGTNCKDIIINSSQIQSLLIVKCSNLTFSREATFKYVLWSKKAFVG